MQSPLTALCNTSLKIKKKYFEICVLPTECIYVLDRDLSTNSDYFPIQYQLIDCHKREEVCLLRGAKWIHISNLVSFHIFKGYHLRGVSGK